MGGQDWCVFELAHALYRSQVSIRDEKATIPPIPAPPAHQALFIVSADLNTIADNVQWDPVASRAGVEFPHLYRELLPMTAVVQKEHIEWHADHFNIPAGLFEASA
jgi:hypothetical protein